MDPNANVQESSPSSEQDPSIRSRPYPTGASRMRHHGEFSQRGRFPYHRRGGGYRPGGNRARNNFNPQQHELSSDNPNYQSTASNRQWNKYFRPSMLEDPWLNLTPQKVPSHGTSLIFDSTHH